MGQLSEHDFHPQTTVRLIYPQPRLPTFSFGISYHMVIIIIIIAKYHAGPAKKKKRGGGGREKKQKRMMSLATILVCIITHIIHHSCMLPSSSIETNPPVLPIIFPDRRNGLARTQGKQFDLFNPRGGAVKSLQAKHGHGVPAWRSCCHGRALRQNMTLYRITQTFKAIVEFALIDATVWERGQEDH